MSSASPNPGHHPPAALRPHLHPPCRSTTSGGSVRFGRSATSAPSRRAASWPGCYPLGRSKQRRLTVLVLRVQQESGIVFAFSSPTPRQREPALRRRVRFHCPLWLLLLPSRSTCGPSFPPPPLHEAKSRSSSRHWCCKLLMFSPTSSRSTPRTLSSPTPHRHHKHLKLPRSVPPASTGSSSNRSAMKSRTAVTDSSPMAPMGEPDVLHETLHGELSLPHQGALLCRR